MSVQCTLWVCVCALRFATWRHTVRAPFHIIIIIVPNLIQRPHSYLHLQWKQGKQSVCIALGVVEVISNWVLTWYAWMLPTCGSCCTTINVFNVCVYTLRNEMIAQRIFMAMRCPCPTQCLAADNVMRATSITYEFNVIGLEWVIIICIWNERKRSFARENPQPRFNTVSFVVQANRRLNGYILNNFFCFKIIFHQKILHVRPLLASNSSASDRQRVLTSNIVGIAGSCLGSSFIFQSLSSFKYGSSRTSYTASRSAILLNTNGSHSPYSSLMW